ncbi:AI-2E family transporter [Gandjariella thermophila]|uniref:AI-2E family transporter n=1 Tax=Gandjariella thermophila TaxID=1931992 RepID=UPI0010F7EBC1|nr:AI-2E family transporter [Gandjariella thermophila]
MQPRGNQPADVTTAVPKVIRVAAALSWRFLVVVGALYVIGIVVGRLAAVVIPVAIALLMSALLAPAVRHLVAWRVPRALATVVVLVGGLAVVGGVLTFVVTEFVNGLPALQAQVGRSLDTISQWLQKGPLHVSPQQVHEYLNRIVATIKENQASITTGALSTAATVGEALTSMLLALFTLIFFLYDGDGIWRFVLRGLPANVRGRMDVAGRRGFASLVNYVRATAVVAVVDAVGIGIGLWGVGVPLAVPLSALVFLGAFVPIVGSVVAGTVAVLVALVANGLIPALIVLGVVIAVMQLEGHVMQPLLMGRAVKLHPLAVVLAIAAGTVVGGIAGALLAVPLLAVVNSGIRSLLAQHEEPSAEPATAQPPEPEQSRAAGTERETGTDVESSG